MTNSVALPIYLGAMTALSAYAANVGYLVVRQLLPGNPPPRREVPAEWPRVTVQLPMYNERFVVERLLETVAAFDYPADKLQIQVIDDSTDDTTELVAKLVARHRANGVEMVHLRRPDRQGFKAGALQYATASATGEFIVVFDADFVPAPDFLKKTIPAFADPQVGVVQTRWEYLNRQDSLLTRLQALCYDSFYLAEQPGRQHGGHYMNFSGSGIVLRRSAIDDTGGWHWDTLAEDADLSFRLQFRGWKIVYLPDVSVPGELPLDVQAYKVQQFRWAKGGLQCLRKHLAQIWTQRDIPLGSRIQSTFFLSAYFSNFFLVIALLCLPWIWWAEIPTAWAQAMGLIAIGPPAAMILAEWRYGRWAGLRHLALWPLLPLLVLGMVANNGKGAIEGLLGVYSPFVRTPKLGDGATQKATKKAQYYMPVDSLVAIECGLAVYGAVSLDKVSNQPWFIWQPLFLFSGAMAFVATLALMQAWRRFSLARA